MKLRLLLHVLGLLLAGGSRLREGLRRQLSRDLVIEIRSRDGVAAHYVIENRRVSFRRGACANAACALDFASSDQGFRVLSAKNGVDRLFAGIEDGSIELRGNAMLLLWFHGLVAQVVPGRRTRFAEKPIPDAYVAPSDSVEVASRIAREPPARELDPDWTAAHEQRRKLLLVSAVEDTGPR